MIEDTTYNGWKNYPTWAVNLWLSNDEGLYETALDIARQVKGDPQENLTRRLALADAYKDWVRDEVVPEIEGHDLSFAVDLAGYALACVDWVEIADAWIETASEVV